MTWLPIRRAEAARLQSTRDAQCLRHGPTNIQVVDRRVLQNVLCTLARVEGIFLDPVYSAKVFAALLDWCHSDRFAPTETVLFWHTGRAPGLFA